MSTLKRFVKDTAIYGLATTLPRVMNIILLGLHTDILATTGYAVNTRFYVWAAFFNVLLTYGMETAFFRFFAKQEAKNRVYATVLIALTSSTITFFLIVLFFRNDLSLWLDLDVKFFIYLILILMLDTLVVAPFAHLRAQGKALKFAGIKLSNLAIYVVLNFFFLWAIPFYGWQFSWYDGNQQVQYIFIANVAASLVTFLLIVPDFFKIQWVFDRKLFMQLWQYGWPIMIAGLAFVVNENLDKLLLGKMLDDDIMGSYAGCYKLAVFMTIFIQAFRLGAEPFFSIMPPLRMPNKPMRPS
ncbi:lipopolysaccharide biosynthesis protein [Croceiramulus getboli]|nr:oligosaccharide flippase family protein [Flavobacteriaceae bacterium YJPT1-3]